MTADPPSDDATEGRPGRIEAAADQKVSRYLLLIAVAAFLGFLTGRVELMAAAAVPALAVALALASTRAPELSATLEVTPARCVEGEQVDLAVRLSSDGPADVEVGVALPPGVTVVEGAARTAVRVEPGEAVVVPVGLRAVRWGVHVVGPVALRARGPGGLVVFETVVDLAVPIRIHPSMERLWRGVTPPMTQAFSGDYRARTSGEGLEFAEVRPFVPGDRIRRLNWRVSSRTGSLSVNRFHPERNADVVLFLDTFADVGPAGVSSLDLAVRGAAILTSHYVRHKDRVGLLTFGGLLHWLRAGGGRFHLQRIVEYLLETGVQLSYAWKDIDYLPRGTLPPHALVVAFSPLEDERAVRALVDIRARRFPLVIVDTLVEDGVGPGGWPRAGVPYRAWRVAREGMRHRLGSAGIPVVRWSGSEPLEAALANVPRFRRGTGVGVG